MGKFFFRLFTGMHAKIVKVTGGRLFGKSVVVLTHKGAKSGTVRDTPLMYFEDGTDYLIVGSAGGGPNNPGWYYNLMANPNTTITLRGEELPVRASDAGARRDELWANIVAAEPRFGSYERKTDRVIPVVILEPQ